MGIILQKTKSLEQKRIALTKIRTIKLTLRILKILNFEKIFKPSLSVHFSFMPEIKIQERTAEALREVATKRKCPTCGERKIDVNIIKEKYRV